MNRRELGLAVAGAIAAPLVARAQRKAMPVIGILNSRGEGEASYLVAAFRQGLQDAGFVEDQNVKIEYRFADDRYDALAKLAADLVDHKVAVIAALSMPAARAAKAATSTIPIVFEAGFDPVQFGLVAGLSRPGGNITGTTRLNVEVGPKRLELLHELLPHEPVIGLLFDPGNVAAQAQLDIARPTARALGLDLRVVNASSADDFEPAFAKLEELRVGGLAIDTDSLFTARQEQLAALALRHRLPAVYENRAFVAAGGLLSYGGSITEAYRQTGAYVGRILAGEQPGELPVQQVTKVEMFVNIKTAKALGLAVPQLLLARADEVIE